MRKMTRGARHVAGPALALALLAGGLVSPGLSGPRPAPKGVEASGTFVRHASQDQQIDFQVKERTENQTSEPPGRIAFASDRDGNFEIYTMNPDGGGLFRVTNHPAEDTQPTWSPDGTRIAFVSNRDGNKEIYVVNADGTGLTRLTNNSAEDFAPAWSPSLTNQRIAFVSGRDGNDEVYVMNADGTAQANVSQSPGGDDVDPAWAPSATLLAFATNRDGDKFEIYRMNSDGSNQIRLTNNSANDVAPTWPPGRITFQSDRDGNDEIYTMNALDGTNQTRVTSDPAFDLDPARSSDGSRLVWVSNRSEAANLEIYAANADGSNVVRLTNNPASDTDPAIQPLPSAATLGTVQFSAAAYSVGEGQGSVTVTVTRTGGTGSATVFVNTVAGSASDRTDFAPVFRTVTFLPGETAKTVAIPIVDDAYLEGDETFSVTLSDAENAVLGAPGTATVTITDNDGPGQQPAPTIFGVTAANTLVRFSAADPGTIISSVNITGLQAGETILGIDVRPATRSLYALGSTGRVYILNRANGAATLVSTVNVALSGTSFGVDFNPVPDRLRVTSNARQNLRINVATGEAIVDGTLSYPAGDPNAGLNANVVASAYANNFPGATSTTLYNIDSNLDVLVRQDPPNNGILVTVGRLGVDTSDVVGFDIANPGGVAYAMLTVGGASQLYTVNLTNGAATLVGNVGGAAIRGITVANPFQNPIDDPEFFVRQQYLDILSREPDPGGFAFWLSRLIECEATPGCDPVQARISVAGGFYFSREFFRKAYFAYRFYRVSLGRQPTYAEFVGDLARLQGLNDAEEEASRTAFTMEWVTRPEFRARYDALSDQAFVDLLADTAGVQVDRAALLQVTLSQGRAQAVRTVVESQAVADRYFREGVVTMLYFAYLKRDPDPSGFQFWLERLDPAAPGPVIGGFLFSNEYRARFGPM